MKPVNLDELWDNLFQIIIVIVFIVVTVALMFFLFGSFSENNQVEVLPTVLFEDSSQ